MGLNIVGFMEEIIRELRLYKLISENSPASIIVTDNEGLIQYVNDRFTRLTGYSKEEACGKNPRILKSGKTPQSTYDKLWKTISSGNEWQGEFINRKKNGDYYWENARISPVKDQEGNIINYIAIKENITEKKKIDEQLKELNRTLEERVTQEIRKRRHQEHLLIEQSKLASMGEMLGAIVHQWRQPLNALGLLLQDIPDAYEYGEIDQTYIDSIVAKGLVQIQYMSSTVDDFRNFFLPSKKRIPFDVIDAIGSSVSLVYPQMKSNCIEISVKHGSKQTIETLGFPNEFKQVVINLLANSRDAILEKRKIPDFKDKVGYIDVQVYEEKEFVAVDISDNGIGFNDNDTSKIFESYFTTKQHGTGIGLYMSKKIIEENMDGSIIASKGEHGAVFSVKLPLPDRDI